MLTGDALFIGDVGRPDLLASIGVTAGELGSQLYDSIHHKLMSLPDAVRVFPGHGAGSACGKNLSAELESTIGQQRAFNYACQPMTEEQFIELITTGQPSAPDYSVYDAILNRKNREVFDHGIPVPALEAAALDAALGRGAVVLDARSEAAFAAGQLTGALNVPADGRFAETAARALTPGEEIIVAAPEDRDKEVCMRLARIGFDNVTGYLDGPETALADRPDLAQRASRLTVPQLTGLISGAARAAAPVLLDVRNAGERETGYIPGSLHIPLAELRRRLGDVPAGRPVVAYCASG